MENNSNELIINFMEFSHINDNDYLLEASFEDFKKKAFDIIDNIIEALKKFFREARVKVDSYIQQHSRLLYNQFLYFQLIHVQLDNLFQYSQ